MPGIIEVPKLVQDAVDQYSDLFANEWQRRHSTECLIEFIVAEHMAVLGIHRKFAETTDQSYLNRFLTAEWNPETLNQRRLDEFQEDSTTRYGGQEVVVINNTLIDG